MSRRTPDRAAGILVEDGQVLLIARERDGRHFLVVPGGKVEPRETARAACVREFHEEVNLVVTVDDLIGSFPDEGRTQWLYRVTRVSGEMRRGDGPEMQIESRVYEPGWFTADQVRSGDLRPKEARAMVLRELAGRD